MYVESIGEIYGGTRMSVRSVCRETENCSIRYLRIGNPTRVSD